MVPGRKGDRRKRVAVLVSAHQAGELFSARLAPAHTMFPSPHWAYTFPNPHAVMGGHVSRPWPSRQGRQFAGGPLECTALESETELAFLPHRPASSEAVMSGLWDRLGTKAHGQISEQGQSPGPDAQSIWCHQPLSSALALEKFAPICLHRSPQRFPVLGVECIPGEYSCQCLRLGLCDLVQPVVSSCRNSASLWKLPQTCAHRELVSVLVHLCPSLGWEAREGMTPCLSAPGG